MRFVVVGTNSNIGRILVPRLIQMGIDVISVGRTHHEQSTERIDWSFGNEFPMILDYEFVLYLPIDFSSIRCQEKFIADNTESLFKILENYEASKVVVPTSFSGIAHSRSRYGQLKNTHQDIANKHFLISLKIGWVDSPKNGGQITQVILKTLKRFPINFLPSSGNQIIYITSKSDLENAINKIIEGHKLIHAYASNPTNLVSLVYGKPPKYNFFGPISHGILVLLPIFYFCFPANLIRAIDSARSLLGDSTSNRL